MMNRNAESKADDPMASFRKGDLKGYRSEDIYEKLNRRYSKESFKVLLCNYYKDIDDINLFDESQENQHVDIDSQSQRSAFRRHNSVPSMDSGDDALFNDTGKFSSTLIMDDIRKASFSKDISSIRTPYKTTEVFPNFVIGGGGGDGGGGACRGQMTYIMLVVTLVGLLLTKTLEYMQLCFVWLQKQIMQFRNVLLGGSTIWEFMDMDDKSRFHRHSKCLLLPFIVMCTILYGFISFLYIIVDFLLNATPPKGLSKFIQKLCN